MKRFICRSLAAISFLLLWRTGETAGRPRYGGTLRVEIRESVHNLDPAAGPENNPESTARNKLLSLLFEPLVRLDEVGRPRPVLALSWQHDASFRTWKLRLRTGVTFHNGSGLTADTVAACLNASALHWKASALSGVLLIESDEPAPDLLVKLAQPSHFIVLRGAERKVFGTGPFQLAGWEPGKRAVLAANGQHWAGRPFLDGITVEMGRALPEQLMDLELGKADFVEVWPNELRRIPKGIKTWSSSPHVLIALAFQQGRAASGDVRLKQALALSIDRSSIYNWLMQKQGEVAAALLPQKLSGYAFLFSAHRDIDRARQLAAESRPSFPKLLLAYDEFDPLARTMAERIALNAREAGISIIVSPRSLGADIRLVRVSIATPSPGRALAQLIELFGFEGPGQFEGEVSPEALHAAESAAVADGRVIPLLHVPEVFGSISRLKCWATSGVDPFGNWHFDDMWLDVEAP